MLALIAPLALLALDPGPPPLKVHVGGRTVAAPEGGWRFGWPGVYFEARFRGTGVIAVVDAGPDRLRLLVDGAEKALVTGPGVSRIQISGLTPGEHVVRLEKIAETQTGRSRLLGFYPWDVTDVLPAPPDRARRIEFVGDSHTVGYGNTSPVRECTEAEVHDTTDTQRAFGPLVANRFDADYRVHAWSGFGIVRNYDGHKPGESLPMLYPRAIPSEPAQAADDGWKPQAIVVNLGTNDFSTELHAGEAWKDQAALRQAWRARYLAFLGELGARQPQARIVLMAPESFRGEVEAVAAEASRGAMQPVRVVPVPALEMTGCNWHPSLKDHRRMADLVQAELARLGIWPD